MGKKLSKTPSLFDYEDVAVPAPVPTIVEPPPEFPLPADLDPTWLTALAPETRKPYWNELQRFVDAARADLSCIRLSMMSSTPFGIHRSIA